jgi:hypothetical protein
MKRVSNNQNIFGRDAAHAEALAKMGQRMLGSLADHIDFNAKMNSNSWCCRQGCGNQCYTLHFHYVPAHMPDALKLIYDDSGMLCVNLTQEHVPNFLHSYTLCDPCYYNNKFDAVTKGMV